MDILTHPPAFENQRSNCSVADIISIAKLASLTLPACVCHRDESSRGRISTASDKENKTYSVLSEVAAKEEERTLKTSDFLHGCRSERIVTQITAETSLQKKFLPMVGENESSIETTNVVDDLSTSLSKFGIVYSPNTVKKRSSLIVSPSAGACDENTLREKRDVSSPQEEEDGVESDASQIWQCNETITHPRTEKSEDYITNAVRLEDLKPKLSIIDTDNVTCCEDVPKILDEPSDADVDSDISELTSDEEQTMDHRQFPRLENASPVKRSDGVWEIPAKYLESDTDSEYFRHLTNAQIDDFLPVPGDIMITTTARRPFLQSYLGSNPGGNVTVFVDRNYFERDQTAIEDIQYNMARFFEPHDMIIRFGKFLPGWVWQPHGIIDFVQYKPVENGRNNSWHVYSQQPNHYALSPPDNFDSALMFQNRIQPNYPSHGCFVPRTADILVRHATGDTRFVHNPDPTSDAHYHDADLVIRLTIEKWPSNDAYRKFTVDLYMFQRMERAGFNMLQPTSCWIFRGRDVQLFGPPQLDHAGRDRELDLNGVEPFIRRPIPHWG